jgi:hypothetical protein
MRRVPTWVGHRLAASSLLEVTVATAILVLVFGLVLGSLARLAYTGPRQLALRGQLLLAHQAAETIRQRAWHARTWRQDGLDIDQEILPDSTTPHLLTLRLTATAQGRPVARLHQLVYALADSTAP